MKRVCIFVDGENFRHSIVDLFENFRNSDYLPSDANWNSFFDLLVERIVEPAELIRTYWYVIELLDMFPYRFPREIDRQTQQTASQFLSYDKEFNLFGVNSPPLGAKSKMKIHHDTPSACGGEIHLEE